MDIQQAGQAVAAHGWAVGQGGAGQDRMPTDRSA